jgi:hypothetical protein
MNSYPVKFRRLFIAASSFAITQTLHAEKVELKSDREITINQNTPTTENTVNSWVIEPWPQHIQVTFPGSALSQRLKSPLALPTQALIEILSSEEDLILKHTSGATTHLSGPMVFHLTDDYLKRTSDKFRTSLDQVGSNLIRETQDKNEDYLNIVSYFVPRVPFAEPMPKRIAGPNEKDTFPIRPLYPPPVHFIETNSLPVQVDIEWFNASGQVNPHSVYLWQEAYFVHAPVSVVNGRKAVISLNKYGRYYWQIEDASKTYLSAPRTIIVKQIGDGEAEAENRTKEPSEEDVSIGMELSQPKHRSHYFGCNISEYKPLFIPVSISIKPGQFSRIDVIPFPRGAQKGLSSEIQPQQKRIKDTIKVTTPGQYEIKSKLTRTQSETAIPLNVAHVQVTDICKNLSETLTTGEIESVLETGEILPTRGTLDFTPLARERLKK